MLIKKTSVPLFLALLLAASLEPSFAQTKRGIRSVDFYNFTYDLYGGAKVTLKNGSYKEKYEPDSRAIFTSKLAVLRYADFDGDGKEEVVVAIRSTQVGSMPVDTDYFIYEYRHGKPRQILHEWREGREGICVQNRSVIIVGVAWEKEEIPHCCPPFTETEIYCWQKGSMVPVKTYRRKNYPFQNPIQFKKARRCENIR